MTDLKDNTPPYEFTESLNRDHHDLEVTSQTSESVMAAWRERMAQQPETDLGIKASALLEEERALRDAEIGWGDTLP